MQVLLIPDFCWISLFFRSTFIHVFQKCDHVMTTFMIVWWVGISCLPGSCFWPCFSVCLQVCLVSHFLARSIQVVTDMSSTRWVQNPSHGQDLHRTCNFGGICNSCAANNLVPRASFLLGTRLCCKLWPRDVCHHVITFLNPRLKPTVPETGLHRQWAPDGGEWRMADKKCGW